MATIAKRGLSIAVAASAALLASVAIAGSPRPTVEAGPIFELDQGGSETQVVSCPGRQLELGAGIAQFGSPSRFYLHLITPLSSSQGGGIFPHDGDVPRRWWMVVGNLEAGDDRMLRAYVTCARAPKATIELTRFSVDPWETRHETASCGDSRRALGGGVAERFPSGEAIFVRASSPVDASGQPGRTASGDVPRRWYGSVYSTLDVPIEVAVYAICAKSPTAKVAATEFRVESGESVGEVAKCPSSKRAVGGGASAVRERPARFYLAATAPLKSFAGGGVVFPEAGDEPRGWYSALTSITKFGGRAKAFAVCMGAGG